MNKDIEVKYLDKNILYSRESEEAVISSILIDPESMVEYSDIILSDFFYITSNKYIIKILSTLYSKNKPIDLVVLRDYINNDSKLKDKESIFTHIQNLFNYIPTSTNISYYLDIVFQKYKLRTLYDICVSAQSRIISSEYTDIHVFIDSIETAIFSLSQEKGSSKDFVALSNLVKNTIDDLTNAYNNQGIPGVVSGFKDLDNLTTGFKNSDLIIIAARPSMGKTAFCLNIAQYIASKDSQGVAFISLEMSSSQLSARLLSSYARIRSQDLQTGRIAKSDFPRIAQLSDELAGFNLFIDDAPICTVNDIRSKVRRLIARENISIVIIDYLQLVRSSAHRYENRQNEIADISRLLKALAREVDKPIIVISQLSRSVEMRGGDYRPKLSDLRDSGAIEQDADLVMFLHRQYYYNKEDEMCKNDAEIILAKHRNGPTGSVELFFDAEYSRFRNKIKS